MNNLLVRQLAKLASRATVLAVLTGVGIGAAAFAIGNYFIPANTSKATAAVTPALVASATPVSVRAAQTAPTAPMQIALAPTQPTPPTQVAAPASAPLPTAVPLPRPDKIASVETPPTLLAQVQSPLQSQLQTQQAQIQAPAQAYADVPAPVLSDAPLPGRVGRIAYASGNVQFYDAPGEGWHAAFLNGVVTTHNSIWTDRGARTEIRIGGVALTLDGDSQLDIQLLDDTAFNATLARGQMSVRVHHVESDESWIVNAAGARFQILEQGRYRIEAGPGQNGSGAAALLTVFAGHAQGVTSGGAFRVEPGHAMLVNAMDNGQTNLSVVDATSTGFDDWASQRDSPYQDSYVRSDAPRYVSPNMTGYEDLDAYGSWGNDPDYGTVWVPTRVAPDWVPYRDGRWAWTESWGWTWVDNAPWGFAPFHYGRWVNIGPRWCWVPGAYARRPAFAPALVGFVGGSNWNVAFSSGAAPAIGWYPLAPWERYAPHYTQNVTYINRVNNITIVNPPQRQVRIPEHSGATVMPQNAFMRGLPVAAVAAALPASLVAQAPRITAPQGGHAAGNRFGLPSPQFNQPQIGVPQPQLNQRQRDAFIPRQFNNQGEANRQRGNTGNDEINANRNNPAATNVTPPPAPQRELRRPDPATEQRPVERYEHVDNDGRNARQPGWPANDERVRTPPVTYPREVQQVPQQYAPQNNPQYRQPAPQQNLAPAPQQAAPEPSPRRPDMRTGDPVWHNQPAPAVQQPAQQQPAPVIRMPQQPAPQNIVQPAPVMRAPQSVSQPVSQPAAPPAAAPQQAQPAQRTDPRHTEIQPKRRDGRELNEK